MEKPSNLHDLLSITALTHSFQQVRRLCYATGEDRFENDAEHSFQLAFVAWYLIEKEKLPLNKEKAFMYALSHDIAEVYAGDVSFYRTVEEDRKKAELEKDAVEKLEKTYSDFPALTSALRAYEEKNDPESKFIYALDKILPMLNILLDEGRSWHFNNVDFEKLYDGKQDKVSHDPVVKEYFILIVEILKNKPGLFPKKQ